METEELHPGEMELPEGFTEIIGYLRSDEGKAWQQETLMQPRDLERYGVAFFHVKAICDGENGDRDRMDSPQVCGAGDCSGRALKEVLYYRWTPGIPPEGAPPLKFSAESS